MTREGVLDTALTTLNADPTASMARIAEAAGIGRATLHRHFATREALVLELGHRWLDRWAQTQARTQMPAATAAGAAGDAEQVTRCLAALVAEYVEDAEVFDYTLTDATMMTIPEVAARSRELQEREIAFLVAAQHAGVVRRDLPAPWLSHALYGLVVATRDALRAGDIAPRHAADLVLTTFTAGAAPR